MTDFTKTEMIYLLTAVESRLKEMIQLTNDLQWPSFETSLESYKYLYEKLRKGIDA